MESLCDAWFAAKKAGIAPGTAAQYEMHVRVHIKPTLGGADAHSIRPKELVAFYSTLRWKAAKESHNVLRQAFEWGIANELVRRSSNPCSFVRPSRRTSIDPDGTYDTDERIRPVDEKDIPTKSEVEKLLIDAETSSPGWWLYLKIASAIGARPGEVCALRRRDVDLEKATIRVEWGADKVSGTVKRPKTPWSIRRLPVSRQLVDGIAPLLPEDPDAFLFPSNTYRGARSPLPCWNSRSVKRRLDKAIARTGMKHVTPHSFPALRRHATPRERDVVDTGCALSRPCE